MKIFGCHKGYKDTGPMGRVELHGHWIATKILSRWDRCKLKIISEFLYAPIIAGVLAHFQ
jgi:hypothetical protein